MPVHTGRLSSSLKGAPPGDRTPGGLWFTGALAALFVSSCGSGAGTLASATPTSAVLSTLNVGGVERAYYALRPANRFGAGGADLFIPAAWDPATRVSQSLHQRFVEAGRRHRT
jgi:hypothetical protein